MKSKLIDLSDFSFILKNRNIPKFLSIFAQNYKTSMAKQVFISHSSKDKDMAEAIYHYLTSQGIRCWIDIHDIRKGIPYAREIMRGIDSSDMLLVVYSRNVNTSEDILNEIDQFHAAHKIILPFLTDETPFSRELDYYLKRRQWITAYNNYRGQLPALRDAIAELLQLSLQQSYSNLSTSTSSNSSKQNQGATSTQPSTYDVILRSAGWAKLQVVKAVKEGLGLGLKEAKELVDSAPSVLKENIEFASASALKSFLEEVGAQVEIKPNKSVIGKSTSQTTMLNSVLLVTAGSYKLQMVKTIKETLGIGLKEAKDLVDEAPSVLRKGLQTWEAQVIKRELEAQGAVVEICSDDMAESNQRKHIAGKETNQNKIKAAQISKEADKEYDAKRFATAMALYFKAVNLSDEYEYYLYDCSRIAYCYCIGQGVDKNYYEAAKWYRIAANRGYTNAQLNLGTLYRNGQGVTKNLAEAARWYQKAAEQGDATAKKYLAELKPYL